MEFEQGKVKVSFDLRNLIENSTLNEGVSNMGQIYFKARLSNGAYKNIQLYRHPTRYTDCSDTFAYQIENENLVNGIDLKLFL